MRVDLEALRPTSTAQRRKRVDALIKDIATHPDNFEMSEFYNVDDDEPEDEYGPRLDPRWNLPLQSFRHTCGTTLCMAGFAAAHATPNARTASYHGQPEDGESDPIVTGDHVSKIAQAWLGLEDDQARQLFYATSLDVLRATTILRHYRDTGEVSEALLDILRR